MLIFPSSKILGPSAIAGAALLLAGCGSMTTYGTGTTAASQTFSDLTSILTIGGKDDEKIDYSPRAPIVEPPTAGALPTPGSGSTTVASAEQWPSDHDMERERVKALAAEKAAQGQSLRFSVPESAELVESNSTVDRDRKKSFSEKLRSEKLHASKNPEEQKKLFADAKLASNGSVDANGNPTRRYLTEPPADLRAPDPESPVVVTEKPKKKGRFKMPDLWPF